MTRDDLLAIWRANLDQIERRIAEYGGETQAPLELVNLRNRARAEIAALEMDSAEDAQRSAAERRLITGSDYALVEIERLRRDLANWQVSVTQEMLEMAEEHVRPSEKMIYDLNRKLDDVVEQVQQINVRLAILERDMRGLCKDYENISSVANDLNRIKGAIGINGDVRRPQGHIYLWMTLITVIIVAIAIIQIALMTGALS